VISPGTAGRWFCAASRRALSKADLQAGYTDLFEIICCDCGDHPDLDYSEVSPVLQQVRGPCSIADGVTAYVMHVWAPPPAGACRQHGPATDAG
jgi:hypothetical protein